MRRESLIIDQWKLDGAGGGSETGDTARGGEIHKVRISCSRLIWVGVLSIVICSGW